MASSKKIDLSGITAGGFSVSAILDESTRTASELLNKDMHENHIYFNRRGFHDHITHGIATLWAVGASSNQLQAHYLANASYQNDAIGYSPNAIEQIADDSTFVELLGNEGYYEAFLAFFQREIDHKGWQATLREYLFGNTAKADAMFVRLYAGIIHPIIHTGIGVEFQQPALVAEALAWTATHQDQCGEYLRLADPLATRTASKSLFEVMDQVLEERISNEEDVARLAAQYTVDPSKLNDAVAEAINFLGYITASAQKTGEAPVINFTLMHYTNCSAFLQPLTAQSGPTAWTSKAQGARLIEGLGRMSLLDIVRQGSMKPNMEYVRSYKPKDPCDWDEVFARAIANDKDDSHLVKFIRAIANGHKVCGDTGGPKAWRMTGENVWLKTAHMALDSMLDFDAIARGNEVKEPMTEEVRLAAHI